MDEVEWKCLVRCFSGEYLGTYVLWQGLVAIKDCSIVLILKLEGLLDQILYNYGFTLIYIFCFPGI